MSTATDPLDLATAQQRAQDATTTAQAVRARVDRGDPTVTPAELGDAETAERFTRQQLTAAQQRDQERREREAADQLAADRAQVQREWSESRREPDELARLRDQAADACRVYLAAAVARLDHLDELTERARAVGFRVDSLDQRSSRRSPIPTLGKAIIAKSKDLLDWQWTRPVQDNLNDRIWGD